MEQNERYTDKLAKYILIAAAAAIIGTIFWYFRNILTYILLAVVISLMAKPMTKLLKKIQIKGRRIPDWLSAVIALIFVTGVLLSVVILIFPIVSNIIKDISIANIEHSVRSIAAPLADLNGFIRDHFPKAGDDFRIELAVVQELQKLFDVSKFSSWVGSAASMISSIGVGAFSVIFIGFFFTKDDNLFTEIVCALVPDRLEKTTEKAIADIDYLLSRYFGGVMIEITGVALINFLGLFLIARLGFNVSIGIAFLTGILNVIPYIGPLLGGAMGTILALILKFSSASPIGLDVNFWIFTIILIAIFCFTQFIDNFFYQPVIYSTSIKAKPLEIFIVLLIVGHIGGPLGMIIAIPCYTVLRVIAFRFFGHIKAIRRLIPDEKLITDEK